MIIDKKNNPIQLTPGKTVLSVGVFDALTARIADRAGVPSIYITGYGAAAAVLGVPDIGLMSMTEMASHVRYISSAVNCPVIADADTGYGGPANVWRTVREYEKAGVNVIQLEDQEWPKKCGHMEGKRLVGPEEMISRIRTAVSARQSEDFKIIARTDAIAVDGFSAAVERAGAYLDAGADILFVEAPQNEQQMKDIPGLFKAPCLANMVEGGKTPYKSIRELEDMGYAIAIFPISTLLAAVHTVRKVVDELNSRGTAAGMADSMIDFSTFNELIGLEDYLALEKVQ